MNVNSINIFFLSIKNHFTIIYFFVNFLATPLDNFYLQQNEPLKSCFLALRDIIISQHKQITPEWKYGCPFFYFKGKMFCYMWFHKKLKQPYIAIMKGKFIEDGLLVAEGRKNIRIMLFDPNNDLPIKKINAILQKALTLY